MQFESLLNEKRHLDQFLDLVQIDSESKKEKEIADYLYNLFIDLGYSPVFDDSREGTGCNADNLIIEIPGTKEGPVIMLNAHMDTVAPGEGVKPVVEDGYVKSSGDTILGGDDKAGIATIIEVVRILKENQIDHNHLLIVLTTAEEIGIDGVKHLNLDGKKADMGYVLDSNGPVGTIISKAPFHDVFKVQIVGKNAHAGIEPEKGNNAIFGAARAIADMQIGRIDEITTTNIGMINGGIATNVVPGIVNIRGEARSLEEDRMVAQVELMKSKIDKHCGDLGLSYGWDCTREYDGYYFTADEPAVKRALEAAQNAGIPSKITTTGGGSDANVFNKKGIPSVVLGIGMENVHSCDEKVSLTNLNSMVDFVLEIVKL